MMKLGYTYLVDKSGLLILLQGSQSHSHLFAMSCESLQSSQMSDLYSLTHSSISLGSHAVDFEDFRRRLPSCYFLVFIQILYNIKGLYCVSTVYCKNSSQKMDLKKTKQIQYPSGLPANHQWPLHMHLPHKADFDAFLAPQCTSTPHWIEIFLLQVDFANDARLMASKKRQIIIPIHSLYTQSHTHACISTYIIIIIHICKNIG